MAADSSPDGDEPGGRKGAWPRHVRMLAVAYALSSIVGPVGFLVLGGLAAVLVARRGVGLDASVAVTLAGALACPMACAAFRSWFRRWGRRRWPGG